jgi:hypothetical protein
MLCKITITEGTLNRLFEVSDALNTDVEHAINQLISEHYNLSGGNEYDDG